MAKPQVPCDDTTSTHSDPVAGAKRALVVSLTDGTSGSGPRFSNIPIALRQELKDLEVEYVGNLWPLKKQGPKSPFAHALVDLGPHEINRKHETYSQYPGEEPIQICLVNHVSESPVEAADPM